MSTRLPDTISDFVAAYFPAIRDITSEQIQSARGRAEAWLRTGFPDEDLRPNSVMGDRVLTPGAHLLAGVEVALQRMASDLDLENVGDGIVFNCPFVTRFLANFGVTGRDSLPSRGVVRLVFNADTAVDLDRSTQFQFGTEVFSLSLPFPGLLQILPVGTAVTERQNVAPLIDMADGTFAVDLPVVSAAPSVVVAGTAASLNVVISTLVSAAAVVDFDSGTPVTGVSEMARRTRGSIVAATPASREGVLSMLQREFPDLTGAFVTLPGDRLNLRSTVSALGFGNPALDVWIHSRAYGTRQTQRIFIPYVTLQPEAVTPTLVTPVFLAKLALVNVPFRLVNVVASDTLSVSWIPGSTAGMTTYSRSRGRDKAPLLTASGTAYEELWISMEMPQALGDDALSTVLVDGVRGAYFDVTYEHDPMVPAVQGVLTSDAYRAAGLDVLVRPMVPVEIRRFNVHYTKAIGINVNLTAARADIATLLRSACGYAPFATWQLIDIMRTSQASDVRSVALDAVVHFTAADKVLPDDAVELDVDFVTGIADAMSPPSYRIAELRGLTPADYVDPKLGLTGDTMAVLGAGIMSFVVEDSTIGFTQV